MAEIADKAGFDGIRYAQAWEDGDVLARAFGNLSGQSVLGICASGDNVLSTLVLDPARVVAVDLSRAQLSCLRVRMAAMRNMDHDAFLCLLGARPSTPALRKSLLARAAGDMEGWDRDFWEAREGDVAAHGLAGVGRFERYFRIFRTCVLPLVHGKATIDAVLERRPRGERATFYAERWNTLRWRLLLATFFSNRTMGLLGRDPAFFEHVRGSLSDHVAERVRHAGVDLDPSANPYLNWILTGRSGRSLPPAWRADNFEAIRRRLDRIEPVLGDVVSAVAGKRFDAFYLSDVFEYMDVPEFEATYGKVLDAANPGASVAYWNMMVPRSLPARHADRAVNDPAVSRELHGDDKAFFYSAFNLDRVR